MTRGIAVPSGHASTSAVTTSWYSGSPIAPGSLVRSSTAIERTRLRQRRDEGLRVEGPVQAHRQQADLLAGGSELVDRLARGADAGTHLHQHALGVGGAAYQNRL